MQPRTVRCENSRDNSTAPDWHPPRYPYQDDRSFVRDLATRADCAAIVCAITGLARSLEIVTTAEGVETEEQFTLVRAAGCSLV